MARMINVTIGTNTQRKPIVVASDTTVREALEQTDTNYATGMVNVDSVPLGIGDLDRSFDDLGVIGERCMVIVVIKADNAA